MICVAELMVNDAPAPLNVTDVAPVNALPAIVTTVPTTPLPGVTFVMSGSTANGVELTAVPAGVVTWTGPDVVNGTVA